MVMGGIALFLLQNQQPVSLVFFGGITILTMPIGVWILIFTAAGVITSLILQLLNTLSRQTTPKKRDFEELKSDSSPFPKQTYGDRKKQQEKRSPPTDYDWANSNDMDDWNIEEPPTETTTTKPNFERSLREESVKPVEVQKQPKSISQKGSVYSYGYREPTDKVSDKTDKVYDANYRVIQPPYRENTEQQTKIDEEEEDWV